MAVTRRHFFYGSLLAGAVPAMGFGSTPSLKAAGYKSPNEKVNFAAIGSGGQGASNISAAAPTENIDRKSTRLNSSHRDLPSFPTRRSSDLKRRDINPPTRR